MRTVTVIKRWYPHCSEIDCYWANARKFWGSRAVNVTKKVVSMLSGGKLLLGNCEGASRGRNLVFVRLYFALPRRCPTCCEILDPLRIARIEGGGCISEYELAFPDMAWDLGYLIHLCFHQHPIKPTKAEWTLKVKGEIVLDHVVFWFSCAHW